MMRVLLIILGTILIIVSVKLIVKTRKKRFRTIWTALTVSPIFITPDLPLRKIDIKKESMIVREGMDFIKVSEKTLKNRNLKFIETYSPEEPDRSRKLLIVSKYERSCSYDIHGGCMIIYVNNNTFYAGKLKWNIVSIGSFEDFHSIRLITDNGEVEINNTKIFGFVEKVYGDYRIEKKSRN